MKYRLDGFNVPKNTLVNGPSQDSLNISIDQSGIVRPRKTWKTFGGMVYQLYLINKRYKKLGVKGNFTVSLPLPEGSYKRQRNA